MRDFFLKLFQKGEPRAEIDVFSIWHIVYIVLIIGGSIGLAFYLRKKDEKIINRALSIFAYLTIGLYLADFIIMPLSQSDFIIDTDKLPFHLCTVVGIFVPFAQFNKKFAKIKDVIVCLAIVSSLMYITYPGSALGGINFYCYKVVETFLFHGCLFAWGFLSLTTKTVKLDIKKIWKELVAIIIIIAWAWFGNTVYSSSERSFDWFFITGSTFSFIPTWLMPFVVLFSVFGMCAIIYGLYYATLAVIKRIESKREEQQNLQ